MKVKEGIMPSLVYFIYENIEEARHQAKGKYPIIIIDNTNVFAKSKEGEEDLDTMQHIAKLYADSSKATFIFIASKGTILPFIINYIDKSHMNSY